MTAKINSYFAVLIITLAGAGAALLIVRVATMDTFATAGYYADIRESVPER